MLQQRVGVLILYFLNFFFNLRYLILFLLDLTLILQLTLVVVLNYLELLKSLSQYFILVEIAIHFPSNRLIILLKLL